MLYFSIENAPGGREKLRGGLWTDGFMLGSWVGSWSDRSRIGNDVSSVFAKFLSHFGRSFFVAGAVFGEFGP